MNESTNGKARLLAGLKAVARLRRDLEQARGDTAECQRALEATSEWAELKHAEGQQAQAAAEAAGAESALRELAIEVAIETGDKRPVDGIEVTKKTTFQITDENAALDYARASMPDALALDKRTFQKMVLALPEAKKQAVPGIAITVNPYGGTKISPDLTAYLVGEPSPSGKDDGDGED